jgi:hypothetical protein
MYSRKHQAKSSAGRGDVYEDDLAKTFRYLTIDPRTEGKSDPKFIGGFNNYPQTPPKVPRPPPPPSLRPARWTAASSQTPVVRRDGLSPFRCTLSPPPPVLHEFTPFQMPTPNREDSKQSLTMRYAQQDFGPPVPPKDFPRKPSPPPANPRLSTTHPHSIA